jgi:hypothetical protein
MAKLRKQADWLASLRVGLEEAFTISLGIASGAASLPEDYQYH